MLSFALRHEGSQYYCTVPVTNWLVASQHAGARLNMFCVRANKFVAHTRSVVRRHCWGSDNAEHLNKFAISIQHCPDGKVMQYAVEFNYNNNIPRTCHRQPPSPRVIRSLYCSYQSSDNQTYIEFRKSLNPQKMLKAI